MPHIGICERCRFDNPIGGVTLVESPFTSGDSVRKTEHSCALCIAHVPANSKEIAASNYAANQTRADIKYWGNQLQYLMNR